jgi:hypothetical protein
LLLLKIILVFSLDGVKFRAVPSSVLNLTLFSLHSRPICETLYANNKTKQVTKQKKESMKEQTKKNTGMEGGKNKQIQNKYLPLHFPLKSGS